MVRQDGLEDLKCYESKVRKGKTTRKKVGMAQSEEHSMQPWKTVIDRSTHGDSETPAQSLGGLSSSE